MARTQERTMLELLREADDSLYRLWRMLPMGEEFSEAVNLLQDKFIQPAIKRQKLNDGLKEKLKK